MPKWNGADNPFSVDFSMYTNKQFLAYYNKHGVKKFVRRNIEGSVARWMCGKDKEQRPNYNGEIMWVGPEDSGRYINIKTKAQIGTTKPADKDVLKHEALHEESNKMWFFARTGWWHIIEPPSGVLYVHDVEKYYIRQMDGTWRPDSERVGDGNFS